MQAPCGPHHHPAGSALAWQAAGGCQGTCAAIWWKERAWHGSPQGHGASGSLLPWRRWLTSIGAVLASKGVLAHWLPPVSRAALCVDFVATQLDTPPLPLTGCAT